MTLHLLVLFSILSCFAATGVDIHQRRGLLATADEVSCTSGVSGRFDAIVIGAGLAGLSAAQRLTQKGWRVLVIEAQDQAGGRVRSVPLASIPGKRADLGAFWIHGVGTASSPNPIFDIAQDTGLETVLAGDDVSLFDGETGEVVPVDPHWSNYEAFYDFLLGLWDNGARLFAQYRRCNCLSLLNRACIFTTYRCESVPYTAKLTHTHSIIHQNN
jgi:hypothetical protein